LLGAPALAAEPAKPESEKPVPPDLTSPEQRDTRHSAYTLPSGMWAVDVGALGVGGGDVFAKLGIAGGLGAGFQLEMNLAHVGIGLLNAGVRWHFIATRHFDLGAGLGFWYGHGDWFWIAGPSAKQLISKLDVINVPLLLSASFPISPSFELDLSLEYTHAEVFGTVSERGSIYRDAYLGVRQFSLRPGGRWFVSKNTALELSAQLPVYTSVPVGIDDGTDDGGRHGEFENVPFSEVWSMEAGLRSRFAPGLFGNLRLHYGEVARAVYGAVLYPSFEVEVRL
jgi:hypothetical protein